jgi:hypothetical protein
MLLGTATALATRAGGATLTSGAALADSTFHTGPVIGAGFLGTFFKFWAKQLRGLEPAYHNSPRAPPYYAPRYSEKGPRHLLGMAGAGGRGRGGSAFKFF